MIPVPCYIAPLPALPKPCQAVVSIRTCLLQIQCIEKTGRMPVLRARPQFYLISSISAKIAEIHFADGTDDHYFLIYIAFAQPNQALVLIERDFGRISNCYYSAMIFSRIKRWDSEPVCTSFVTISKPVSAGAMPVTTTPLVVQEPATRFVVLSTK